MSHTTTSSSPFTLFGPLRQSRVLSSTHWQPSCHSIISKSPPVFIASRPRRESRQTVQLSMTTKCRSLQAFLRQASMLWLSSVATLAGYLFTLSPISTVSGISRLSTTATSHTSLPHTCPSDSQQRSSCSHRLRPQSPTATIRRSRDSTLRLLR